MFRPVLSVRGDLSPGHFSQAISEDSFIERLADTYRGLLQHWRERTQKYECYKSEHMGIGTKSI